MSSSGIETIIGSLPKKKTFTVISLFESGLADFDNNIAFINLDTLNEFFNLDKKVSESIQKKLGLSNYQMQWFVFLFGLVCGLLIALIF